MRCQKGPSYRNWYSKNNLDEALLEQKKKLPDGILAWFGKPRISLTENLPSKLIDLCSQFMENRIGSIAFASEAETIRTHMNTEEAMNHEPWHASTFYSGIQ